MVHPARLELATLCSEDRCSNPLSYGCVQSITIPQSRGPDHILLKLIIVLLTNMYYKYIIPFNKPWLNATQQEKYINAIVKGFSTLSGPLQAIRKKSFTGVSFRPVNSTDTLSQRAWARILAYGSLICTLTYGLVLFWPTGWVALINPLSPQTAANWAILVCLLTLQAFVLFGTYAAVRATLKAQNPIPLKPLPNQRVAFVTTRAPGEPIELVETTLKAAIKVSYKSGTVDVWLLDETDASELKQMCARLGVRYFTRARDARWRQVNPHHSWLRRYFQAIGLLHTPSFDPRYAAKTKHGNFNAWLAHLEEWGIEYDILAGVDTDHVPHSNYLHRLLGYFNDADVAYVVGPQVYGNYRPGLMGLVTRWSESQASFFQAVIQRSANASQSAMLVGTNYAIRMSVLKQIGGFQACITEDMATGMVIHANHNLATGNPWKSVYTPDVLAIGEGPNSWGSYFTQQWRWAAGTFDTWRRLVWRLMPRYSRARALHYLLILSFYPIVALTWALAVISSALYLVLGASAVSAEFGQVLSLYFTCMILQLSLYFWSRRFNVSPHEPRGSLGISGMVMTALTGPVYLAALIGVIRGKRGSFVVTKKGDTGVHDSIQAFKLSLGWLSLMGIIIAYGIFHAHTNIVMLSWAILTAILCAIPVILGLHIPLPKVRSRRTSMSVQRGNA